MARLNVAGQTTAATPPVGYVSLPALGGSDTIMSLPLARPVAYGGAIASVSGNTLVVSGSPNWTVNQFVPAPLATTDTYYVRFSSGAMGGRYYTVTANDTGSLTLDWNGDSSTGLKAGDTFLIIPYWTLGTAFPAANAVQAFVASASSQSPATEVLMLNQNYAGINPPVAAAFYFLNGSWRAVGQDPSIAFDSTVLPPDTYLIVRNLAGGSTLPLIGAVIGGPLAVPINAQATGEYDNTVCLSYPGTVTLAASGLISSGAFQPSRSAVVIGDELLVFDNREPEFNRTPITIYFYLNSGWRKIGSPITQDFSSDSVFVPGAGVVIRKGATTSAEPIYWIYQASEP